MRSPTRRVMQSGHPRHGIAAQICRTIASSPQRIEPLPGDADALNEADVTKWFADLNNRAGPGAANRVTSILNHMLNKAEAWGYRLVNTNPCRIVRLNKRRQCERFLTLPELSRLGAVLAEKRAGEDKVRSIAATAITLLLLTGCRSSEVMSLQWEDVRGNRLNLKDSKTGARTVWLGDEARARIDTIPRHKNIPWLFWNLHHRCPMQTAHHYWYEIREKTGLPNVRNRPWMQTPNVPHGFSWAAYLNATRLTAPSCSEAAHAAHTLPIVTPILPWC